MVHFTHTRGSWRLDQLLIVHVAAPLQRKGLTVSPHAHEQHSPDLSRILRLWIWADKKTVSFSLHRVWCRFINLWFGCRIWEDIKIFRYSLLQRKSFSSQPFLKFNGFDSCTYSTKAHRSIWSIYSFSTDLVTIFCLYYGTYNIIYKIDEWIIIIFLTGSGHGQSWIWSVHRTFPQNNCRLSRYSWRWLQSSVGRGSLALLDAPALPGVLKGFGCLTWGFHLISFGDFP